MMTHEPVVPRVPEPPGLAKTIVITVFFGLFGLIPAYVDSQKAERAGQPSGRYWVAFGVSLAGTTALYGIVVVVAFALLVSSAEVTSSASPAVELTSAPASPVAPTPRSAAPAPGRECAYAPADTASNPNLTDVGVPSGDVPATGLQAVTMTTNYGDIGLTLERANAPCAAGAIVYLADQGFFDGTNCHRETNSPGLQVLQCGDPSGTGAGGAAFGYPTQVTGTETYPRGTIAMANAGQGTDGSQFFLVFGDSLQGNPNYTVVGRIDRPGLAVLDSIAARGIAGGATDGAPAQPVTITAMTVAS